MSEELGLGRVPTHARLLVGVRAGLIVLGAALGILSRDANLRPAPTLALLVIAAAASIPPRNEGVRAWLPVAESVAAAAVIASAVPLNEALIPYLLAPSLAAGLLGGAARAVTASGLAGIVLLLPPAFGVDARIAAQPSSDFGDYASAVSRWVLLSLAVGLLAAWVRRVQHQPRPQQNESYAAAYRLLSQLRVVSRQLAGGLDPVSLAHSLLQTMAEIVPYDRAALYTRSSGGVLVPLAFEGTDRVEWHPDVSVESVWTDAWDSHRPQQRLGSLSGDPAGYSAVIPLRIGTRSFGLVGLERAGDSFAAGELIAATEIAEEASLRLETAQLFAEVRSIATAEERRRVAREIHDGIAQELASLGYVVDDLTSRCPDVELAEELRELRAELTRVISELRLSIFDLRSEVQDNVGLGTALSDYVRSVGAGSSFIVHLILDESPTRLRVEAEAELLRIAQEAITNARKHARAENLWVTCRVDPPDVVLRVEDDGQGMGRGRVDSFGLEIMRERAARLGATLTVRSRDGGGTLVEVALGNAAAGSDNEAAERSTRVHDRALGR